MLISTLSYSKLESSIQVQPKESEKSNESKKMFFILWVLRPLTLPFT